VTRSMSVVQGVAMVGQKSVDDMSYGGTVTLSSILGLSPTS